MPNVRAHQNHTCLYFLVFWGFGADVFSEAVSGGLQAQFGVVSELSFYVCLKMSGGARDVLLCLLNITFWEVQNQITMYNTMHVFLKGRGHQLPQIWNLF